MTARVFVGVGSNVGDRLGFCRTALRRMAELPSTRLQRTSPILETAPAEGAGGGPFLNLVAELETDLRPEDLLRSLQAIEADLGRAPDHPPLAPRTIDLDILLFGAEVRQDAALTIPHPRMASRRFVLEPLAAIAPEVRHPVLGLMIRELLQRLDDRAAGE
jgi:2-amino-4-hydroxy-6-hydroxymethyldihydropteridine diphosphokinase